MRNRNKFVNNLNDYHEHLLLRLDKGSDYLENMEGDVFNTKEYHVYEEIIKELSEVEKLMIYYKMDLWPI